MKPTVGRIVHYTPFDNEAPGPWAAVITLVSTIDETAQKGGVVPIVNLTLFPPYGIAEVPSLGVAYSEEPKPGCWSWPPRTP